jgi:beta-lactamase class A
MRVFQVIAFLAVSQLTCAQQTDHVLTKKLGELVKGFHGQAGIYVRHLKTGKEVRINADTIFPTASIIKIPITIGMFDMIEKGEIRYDSILTYRDSLLYPGDDLLGSFKDGEKIALKAVLMLMITTSDNTASLWCQHLAGTGTTINRRLAQNGLEKTRVNSRTPGRESEKLKYGWGQTTPLEIATLMTRIHRGEVVSKRASERIYRNLIRIYWDTEALSQIPPYVQVASKQGAVDQSRSEVALVNAPHGDYVFAVLTKDLKDTSWTYNNEGWMLIRKISAVLWRHFEPDHKWEPAKGIEEWK